MSYYESLDRQFAEAKTELNHGLYERASAFLYDYKNPLRLSFDYGGGAASIGQEIDGAYYRFTNTYKHTGFRLAYLNGLVAVEKIPDEAVKIKDNRQVAASRVGERLWRLRPARIEYEGMGYNGVFSADIEDLAATEVRSAPTLFWGLGDAVASVRQVNFLPEKNFRNRLYGENLERAQNVIGELLERVGA